MDGMAIDTVFEEMNIGVIGTDSLDVLIGWPNKKEGAEDSLKINIGGEIDTVLNNISITGCTYSEPPCPCSWSCDTTATFIISKVYIHKKDTSKKSYFYLKYIFTGRI